MILLPCNNPVFTHGITKNYYNPGSFGGQLDNINYQVRDIICTLAKPHSIITTKNCSEDRQMNNNQLNPNGSSNFVGYSNGEQNRTHGMDEIKKKTQDFRKEIRRDQLDKYFKSKRKLFFQTPKKKTLLDCLEAIESNNNTEENVCSLVNLLALKKPFEHYSSQNTQINEHLIEAFCTRMVHLLLNQTIPYFQKQPKCRIYCINALSNLFADELCPNVRYVEVVVETIDKRYGGLDVWDVDEEMIEVFYMISNLMRKNLASAKLLPIQILLSWAQGGVLEIPSDPLKCLTEGITQIFTNVDQTYNPKHDSLFILHFSANRQMILQNFMRRLIQNSCGLKKLKGTYSLDQENIFGIFKLFNKNIQYILKIFCQKQSDQEEKKMRQMFVNKAIDILHQHSLKKEVVAEIGKFFVNLLEFYPDPPEEVDIDGSYNYLNQEERQHLNKMIANIHQFLLRKEGLHRLFSGLAHLNIDCKRVILKIIHQLLASTDTSLNTTSQDNIYQCYRWVMAENNLETIITDLISDMGSRIKDIQMLKTIVEIYFTIISRVNGKLCTKMREALRNLINEEVSFIDKDFCEYIDGILELHKEKINMYQL